MTEHSTEQRGDTARTSPAGPTTPTAPTTPTTPTTMATTAPATSGWVRFAGVVMTVVGIFGVIQGLLALLAPTYYIVTSGGVVAVGIGTWAWVHLIVGALVALTGGGLLSGDQPWARGAGMAIVGVSLLVQLAFLPAAPLWSILVIVLDVMILMALAGAPTGGAQRA